MFDTRRNLMDSREAIARFLIIRRIENKWRLLLTTSIAVLNNPELSNIEKILYSVLYADRWAKTIISLTEILDDFYFFLENGNGRRKNRRNRFS